MPVFQESPWTAWKFIKAPWSTTLSEPTDQSDRSGPTIFGNRQTNEPFSRDVRPGPLVGLRGLGLGLVVVVVGTVVVVEPGVVVVDDGTVVVVVVEVVVVVVV